MTDYDNDEDEVEGNEPEEEEEGGASAPGNRNFLLALGIMGGIFLLLLIALAACSLPGRGEAQRPTSMRRTR